MIFYTQNRISEIKQKNARYEIDLYKKVFSIKDNILILDNFYISNIDVPYIRRVLLRNKDRYILIKDCSIELPIKEQIVDYYILYHMQKDVEDSILRQLIEKEGFKFNDYITINNSNLLLKISDIKKYVAVLLYKPAS